MKEEFSRTAQLLGEEGVARLTGAAVAVFGVGGVGSYCVEALARAGIGRLILIDSDRVARSNINRQLIATQSTVDLLKTEAAARRIADINPDCQVVQQSELVSHGHSFGSRCCKTDFFIGKGLQTDCNQCHPKYNDSFHIYFVSYSFFFGRSMLRPYYIHYQSFCSCTP